MWPPPGTVLRSLVATALAIVVGTRWVTTGAMVFLELSVLSLAVIALLIVMGELTPRERQLAVSALRQRRVATRRP